MSEKILVPVLGESITEATVSKWLKKQGDSVIADEAIVELETDKVNLEVPASTNGVISEINAKEGDTVEVVLYWVLFQIQLKQQILKKLKKKKNQNRLNQ